MKRFLAILFLSALSISLNSCFQTENFSSQDANTYGGIDPNDPTSELFIQVKEIWRVNCTPCHAFNGMSKDELVAAGLVVEGDAQNSLVYNQMRNSSGTQGAKDMPPWGSLTSHDIQTVESWINSL